MSAMPAGWSEPTDLPRVAASPARTQRRAERRAEQKLARRSRQRWAVAGGAILAVSFASTVAILELLH